MISFFCKIIWIIIYYSVLLGFIIIISSKWFEKLLIKQIFSLTFNINIISYYQF